MTGQFQLWEDGVFLLGDRFGGAFGIDKDCCCQCQCGTDNVPDAYTVRKTADEITGCGDCIGTAGRVLANWYLADWKDATSENACMSPHPVQQYTGFSALTSDWSVSHDRWLNTVPNPNTTCTGTPDFDDERYPIYWQLVFGPDAGIPDGKTHLVGSFMFDHPIAWLHPIAFLFHGVIDTPSDRCNPMTFANLLNTDDHACADFYNTGVDLPDRPAQPGVYPDLPIMGRNGTMLVTACCEAT